jgi:hypothetical protein
MAQYVKFMRGTPAAFERLATKQEDTLYFIYEKESDEGKLYLGDRLIAGGDIGSTSIDALRDVLISEGLVDGSILVYNAQSQQWVNKSLDEVITVFVPPTASSGGVAGLVPAPPQGQTNLFLRSDGKWAVIDTEGPKIAHNILTVTNDSQKEHSAIIAELTTDVILVEGDIFIIKDKITDGNYQHTAYVYDGSKWEAMDGNYNAENVYFSQDLVTTTAIGNIALTNGQATITAAGKNLKQVFDTIFVKEKNPTITQPSVGITASANKAYEVGTKVTPTYTGTFSAGKYSYGPDTGVVASNWHATDSNAVSSTGKTGSFPELTVTDTMNYAITVYADWSDGAIPKTNTGNDYSAGKISAATGKSATSAAITGYRNTFWGTMTAKETLDSSTIRSLDGVSNEAYSNGSSFVITVPVGCLRVVFAYPATLQDVTSVLDKNDSNANIVSGFNKMTLNVKGVNDYDAISYKVYTMDFANPYDAANEFTVTI